MLQLRLSQLSYPVLRRHVPGALCLKHCLDVMDKPKPNRGKVIINFTTGASVAAAAAAAESESDATAAAAPSGERAAPATVVVEASVVHETATEAGTQIHIGWVLETASNNNCCHRNASYTPSKALPQRDNYVRENRW